MGKIIRENSDATIRIIEEDGMTYIVQNDNTDEELEYENKNDAIRKYGILIRGDSDMENSKVFSIRVNINESPKDIKTKLNELKQKVADYRT